MDLTKSQHITIWIRQALIPDCELMMLSGNLTQPEVTFASNSNFSVLHFGTSTSSAVELSQDYIDVGQATLMEDSGGSGDAQAGLDWVPTYSNDLQVLVILIAYTISFVLSFGGNLMAIVVFVRYDSWPKDLRILLTNICLAGVLSAVLCLPFTLLYQLLQSWVFTRPMCRIITFLQLAATIATILTHLAIGLNRLWVIVYPLKASTFKEYVWRIVLCCWVTAGVISAPNLITTDTKARGGDARNGCYDGKQYLMCNEQWEPEYATAYTWTLMLCMYFLPMIVLLCIYAISGYTLSKSSLDIIQNERTIAKRLETKRRVLRMLMIIFALFAISWLPLHIFFIFQSFHEDLIMANFETAERVYWIIHWLATSNSFQNPIVYCCFDDKFKIGIVHLFGRKTSRQLTISSAGRSNYTYQNKTGTTMLPSTRQTVRTSPMTGRATPNSQTPSKQVSFLGSGLPMVPNHQQHQSTECDAVIDKSPLVEDTPPIATLSELPTNRDELTFDSSNVDEKKTPPFDAATSNGNLLVNEDNEEPIVDMVTSPTSMLLIDASPPCSPVVDFFETPPPVKINRRLKLATSASSNSGALDATASGSPLIIPPPGSPGGISTTSSQGWGQQSGEGTCSSNAGFVVIYEYSDI